jgi:hypothetical protein
LISRKPPKKPAGRRATPLRPTERRKHNADVQLYAFDILALDGEDPRDMPLSMRKANLPRLLARQPDGIFVAPFEQGEIGPDLFRAACNMDGGETKATARTAPGDYATGSRCETASIRRCRASWTRSHEPGETAPMFGVMMGVTASAGIDIPDPWPAELGGPPAAGFAGLVRPSSSARSCRRDSADDRTARTGRVTLRESPVRLPELPLTMHLAR